MHKHDIDLTNKLRVLSIYQTFDGEANAFHVGTPSVFIRLSGCSVGCVWCDTKYSWSFKRGRDLTPEEIVNKINELFPHTSKVTITGGEPLEQYGPAFYELIYKLVSESWLGINLTIETSGTVDWSNLFGLAESHNNMSLVIDYKLSSAFEGIKNKWDIQSPKIECLKYTKAVDVLKFVIGSSTDFYEASVLLRPIYKNYGFNGRVVFGPDHTSITPDLLASWMLSNDECLKYNVGLNMQMHKYIWPDDFRREETQTKGFDYTKEVIRG